MQSKNIKSTENMKSMKSLKKWLGPCFSLMIISVAIWFLLSEFQNISIEAITQHIQSLSTTLLFTALACVAGSYFCLTLYDRLALQFLNKPLPYRIVGFTAFIAYAVGHNVGFSAISGGTVRFRLYTIHGITAANIAKLTVFITVTFTIGISFLLGIALLLIPTEQTSVLALPFPLLLLLSAFLIGFPVLYLAMSFFAKAPMRFGRWSFQFPQSRIAFKQLFIALAELFFASATLYVLLFEHLSVNYFSFLGFYLLAMLVGIISSVPGGIGVFEAVLLAALPQVDREVLLATMIVYRALYYVLPLAIAILLFLPHEFFRHHNMFKQDRLQE